MEPLLALDRKLNFLRDDPVARASMAKRDVEGALEKLRIKAVTKVLHVAVHDGELCTPGGECQLRVSSEMDGADFESWRGPEQGQGQGQSSQLPVCNWLKLEPYDVASNLKHC